MTHTVPYPDYVRSPDEKLVLALGSLLRHVGSRIAGRIAVPHPAPPDAPALIDRDWLPNQPADMVVQGRFHGDDWADDDSIGWWVEAGHPGQDAVLMANAMAICHGDAGVLLSDRRIVVITAGHLFVYYRENQQREHEKKSFLGKVLAAAGSALSTQHNHWEGGDKLVVLWEMDASRVRGTSLPLVGRSIPFPRVVRIDFVDGSVLYARYRDFDLVNGEQVKPKLMGPREEPEI
jgi:hypothetical protein